MTNRIISDELGRRLELVERPTASDAQRAIDADVREAVVMGFGMASLPDLSVLADVIESLNVVTLNLQSDAAVVSLPNLRSLSLQSYAKNPIDLAKLPNLETLHFRWRTGMESAFSLAALRGLSIDRYPFESLEYLKGLTGLTALGIASSRLQTLAGIESLKALERLWLVDNRRLNNVEALATDDVQLKVLVIQACRRVGAIDALAHQTGLEELHLLDSGDIKSLKPLRGLNRLRRVFFFDDTRIVDGDLSVLLDLPALEKTSFANRRTYSHTFDEIEAALEVKGTS